MLRFACAVCALLLGCSSKSENPSIPVTGGTTATGGTSGSGGAKGGTGGTTGGSGGSGGGEVGGTGGTAGAGGSGGGAACTNPASFLQNGGFEDGFTGVNVPMNWTITGTASTGPAQGKPPACTAVQITTTQDYYGIEQVVPIQSGTAFTQAKLTCDVLAEGGATAIIQLAIDIPQSQPKQQSTASDWDTITAIATVTSQTSQIVVDLTVYSSGASKTALFDNCILTLN